ncbi:MAG: hypothetical protein O3B65_00475 [Chloroflexi bacterium]|nr:hypothetical protein [Chloroflexota bacterium]
MTKISVHGMRLAMASAVVVIGLAAVACGSSANSPKPIDLVPAQSDLIGSVDLAQVLGDADVQAAYQILAASSDAPDVPATFDDLLAFAEEKIGVDLNGFNEVIFFGDSEVDGSNRGGLLASGSPSQEEISDALLAADSTQFEPGEYGRQTILVSREEDAAMAVLGDVLVIGSLSAVHAVIDVFNGDASLLGGDILAAYNDLGDVWVKAVFDVPAGATDDLGDLGGMGLPVDVGGLLNIERVTLVADKNGDDGVLAVTLVYPSEEEATETAETIDALLTLISGFSDDPQLQSLSDALSISSTGASVELEIRQTIQEILDSLEGVLESGVDSLVPSFSL